MNGLLSRGLGEIREELVAQLASPETLVFAADEVHIDQEAIVRKA